MTVLIHTTIVRNLKSKHTRLEIFPLALMFINVLAKVHFLEDSELERTHKDH